MKVSELEKAVGGLSNPTKMPGLSYGIPAKDCMIGSLMRKINGSVCSKCYAHKGTYSFSNTKKAQQKRFDILKDNLDEWANNMIYLIEAKLEKKTPDLWFFRWHDSGDIQSYEHLIAIADIAVSLSWVNFWLPTKEKGILRKFLAEYECPENLVIRLSAPLIGQKGSGKGFESTVGVEDNFQCEAYKRGGKCGDCRACWDPKVQSVNYPQH